MIILFYIFWIFIILLIISLIVEFFKKIIKENNETWKNTDCFRIIIPKIKEQIHCNMDKLLEQNIIFVKSYEPYDFTDTMGQLGVEINYTNGDRQILTTPMPPERGRASSDFKDEAEFYAFIKYLKDNDVKRKE